MKFKVRAGFVCPVTTVTKGEDGQPDQIVVNTFAAGASLDFDEIGALAHLHKLEPVDKEAIKFAESRFVPEPPPVSTGGIDPQVLAQAIAMAIVMAGKTPNSAAA